MEQVDSMKNLFIVLTVLVALAGGYWYLMRSSSISSVSTSITPITPLTPVSPATTPYVAPALTTPYTNGTYHFSLKLPDSFTAKEIPDAQGQGTSIVIQDSAGQGIQIAISPFEEDLHHLTAERIQQDVPDMTMTDVEPIQIGSDYSGVVFHSNNDAFGGDSREVWFVYQKNLYQVSTYARLDPLLRSIFSSWRFL